MAQANGFSSSSQPSPSIIFAGSSHFQQFEANKFRTASNDSEEGKEPTEKSKPDNWRGTESNRMTRRKKNPEMKPMTTMDQPIPFSFDPVPMPQTTEEEGENANNANGTEDGTPETPLIQQNGGGGGHCCNGSLQMMSMSGSNTASLPAASSSSDPFKQSTTDLPQNRPHLLLELAVPVLLIASILSELIGWPWAVAIYALFRVLLISAVTDYGRRAVRTVPRDIQGLRLLIAIKWAMFRADLPLHFHFLRLVRRHPGKQCLVEIQTGRRLNFAQFNGQANRFANLFKGLGFAQDEVLALFMENGIDFFAAWLGLSKLGVVTAWVNTNLRLEQLAHSIRVAQCRAVMTTEGLRPVLLDAVQKGLLPEDLAIFVALNGGEAVEEHNTGEQYTLDNEEEPESPKTLDFKSVLCYIYTSGTTGPPKAAIIKHYRYFLMGFASGSAFGIRPSDRLYIYMPMYHSAGGILGASQVLIRGCSAAIRTKFSASRFWTDCIQHECTVSQYIGEICRYLLAQQPRPDAERRHRVRLMFGNGLRPQIWRQFVQRFGIHRIGELYGSTEGNSNLVNIDNHPGACGFMPIYTFLHGLYPIRLLKVDAEGQLVRDSRGYYVQCFPGDTGEVVATIKQDDPILRFEGYLNQGETGKKIIENCLRPGDCVFTSGDLLEWDRLGYLYFRDRRGDTFRWRGENVSTTEVEGLLQPVGAIADATCFGVEVPGREGRAGMIGVALARGADVEAFIDELSTRVSDHLASYAIPVFVRLCEQVDRTGTFKLKKSRLQRDGWELGKCAGNAIFYWDSDARHYVKLDEPMQRRILSGEYARI